MNALKLTSELNDLSHELFRKSGLVRVFQFWDSRKKKLQVILTFGVNPYVYMNTITQTQNYCDKIVCGSTVTVSVCLCVVDAKI